MNQNLKQKVQSQRKIVGRIQDLALDLENQLCDQLKACLLFVSVG